MAASILQCCLSRASTVCGKRNGFIQLSCSFASNYTVDNDDNLDDSVEETFKDIRDVSRLPERLKVKLKKNTLNAIPAPEYVPSYMTGKPKDIRRFQRKTFAKYGHRYKINPASLWPTEEDLAKEKLRDSYFDPPLEESLVKIRVSKEEEEETRRQREEQIEKNMKKMKDWIKAYEERQKTAMLTQQKSKERKQMLVDKLYDHFGYKLHLQNPKAVEYLKNLADQEKKEKKLQQKQFRKDKAQAQLKEMLQEEE
ncbi:large ribosomal subunit protein mL64-like [Saccostrea echinata]|uniref:large ribosomal subunit protein mL64-like n=1 Tax=Saccostrea echinata TaxID=191078 RepID=UPI002A833D92|nr:large ribosomal subunit protein mL64-like [Saccostrea echinata]